jgi:hypothetical protein
VFGPAVSAVIIAHVMVGRAGIATMEQAWVRRVTVATPEPADTVAKDVLSSDTGNAN